MPINLSLSLSPGSSTRRAGGGSSLPATAVNFPTGALFTRSASGLAVGGVVGDFSGGMWFFKRAHLYRYLTFFSLQKAGSPGELSKYFYFGSDNLASPGIAAYDQNGAHCHEAIPTNTWAHLKFTKTARNLRCWINNTVQTWQLPGDPDVFEMAWPEYGEIDRICLGDEIDYNESSWNGALRAPYFKKGSMTLAEHQAQAIKSSPLITDGVPVANAVGGWPFATSASLADALGGEAFTLSGQNHAAPIGGPYVLGADVAGPDGITQA